MKSLYTIGLLFLSNAFMTVAWYGHLKFKEMKWSENLGLAAIILISWGIALFEYTLRCPPIGLDIGTTVARFRWSN